MWPWIGCGFAVFGIVLYALFFWHRRNRVRVYRHLAESREDRLAGQFIEIACRNDLAELHDRFSRFPIVRLDHFLTDACLQKLLAEARNNLSRMVANYIPTHKKGRTLSYENIHRYAPGCLAFYHSPEVQGWISQIVGRKIFPTPEQDQSSLSVLCYVEPGDHIQWHFDHNFYRGRHFTVLLSLANRRRDDSDLSSSKLMYRDSSGGEQTVETTQNTLVVFEGQRVLHRATPLGDQEERLMLSMTYCTDPRNSWWKEFARRVKDTAFYGIRALWD